MMGSMWILWLLGFAVLIAILFRIVNISERRSERGGRVGSRPEALTHTTDAPGRTPAERSSAEETLRHRLAEGEIDEEEYQRKLETLRSK